MTDHLSQLRICVEKPLINELGTIKQIRDRSNSKQHFQKLTAAFLTQKMWPKNSTINVSFLASSNDVKNVDWTPMSRLRGQRDSEGNPVMLDPLEEEVRKLSPVEAIKKVVRERIQPIVGLKFVFVDQGGDVRISFNPHGGSYSLVGTDCLKSTEQNTMNFGWLDVGTIIHEFGHVLGLIHEHQNPKGSTIDWDDSAVYAWAKSTQGWDQETTYHNIMERYGSDQLNGSNFDPKSIMLYFFPASLTVDNKGTDPNYILSKTDAEYIAKVYPGGHMTADEFYKNVYGSLTSSENFWSKIPWSTIGIIVLVVVGMIIAYFIFRSITKKRGGRGKYASYSAWKKHYQVD